MQRLRESPRPWPYRGIVAAVTPRPPRKPFKNSVLMDLRGVFGNGGGGVLWILPWKRENVN